MDNRIVSIYNVHLLFTIPTHLYTLQKCTCNSTLTLPNRLCWCTFVFHTMYNVPSIYHHSCLLPSQETLKTAKNSRVFIGVMTQVSPFFKNSFNITCTLKTRHKIRLTSASMFYLYQKNIHMYTKHQPIDKYTHIQANIHTTDSVQIASPKNVRKRKLENFNKRYGRLVLAYIGYNSTIMLFVETH